MPTTSHGTSVPRISVVIAARNASGTLGDCLRALTPQLDASAEAVVVDDASTDGTAQLAETFPARVVRLDARRGPAGARNEGAREARAPLVLFLDADVRPGPAVVARALALMEDPSVDAVSGAYDAEPAVRTLVSLFKNLAHHHFHARHPGPATTFFSACGVVRRERFLEVGGFDAVRFARPSVEDLELGARLTAAGCTLRLDPSLQVKHLKRWTLANLVYTDVVRRAVPWMLLALERGGLPNELNAAPDQRFAALAAVGMAASVGALPFTPAALVPLALSGAAALAVNRDLFALFRRAGGLGFAIAGFALQQLYYLYSLAGAAAGLVLFVTRRTPTPAEDGKRPHAAERAGAGTPR